VTDSRLRNYHPLLLVVSVAETVDYYRTKLGFEHAQPTLAADWLEADFALMRRDDVYVMFKALPGVQPNPNGRVHDAFIFVRELEPLRDELRRNGVKIQREIAVAEGEGVRAFYFEDNNGYLFCCGHPLG
jgi:catechol 2,3-dioxygenase-like lactoylglutathione lyase family enzyme